MPRRPPYVPKRFEDGKYVHLRTRHRKYTPATHAAVIAIERRWISGSGLAELVRQTIRRHSDGWWGKLVSGKVRDEEIKLAFLRKVPNELWNELMDLLPICECGRPVAPSRARYQGVFGNTGVESSCTEECRLRRGYRRYNHRRTLRKREERAEARALSEALG